MNETSNNHILLADCKMWITSWKLNKYNKYRQETWVLGPADIRQRWLLG